MDGWIDIPIRSQLYPHFCWLNQPCLDTLVYRYMDERPLHLESTVRRRLYSATEASSPIM